MNLYQLSRHLPADFRIELVDVGSAGGLHRRWRPFRQQITALLFDPLDANLPAPGDRWFPVALAAGSGQATLHLTRRISMSSTLLPNAAVLASIQDKPGHTEIVKTINVATDALDNIVAREALRVDAVKIDTQGGEFDILQGARHCLQSSVVIAEVEVSMFERYLGLRPFHEVVAMMQDQGLELIELSRIKRYRYQNQAGIRKSGMGGGDRPGRIAFADALFLRNDRQLLARLRAATAGGDRHAALRAVVLLLVYGKADLAAWVFDASADLLDASTANAVRRTLDGVRRRRFGRGALHLVLDYLARRV